MLNGAELGKVTVVTTTDGDHPPEYYAQRIVDRLIVIGDRAPEPIKAQALAFRQQMLVTVPDGLKRAIESDRLYRK